MKQHLGDSHGTTPSQLSAYEAATKPPSISKKSRDLSVETQAQRRELQKLSSPNGAVLFQLASLVTYSNGFKMLSARACRDILPWLISLSR
jgi:hypothetical protein